MENCIAWAVVGINIVVSKEMGIKHKHKPQYTDVLHYSCYASSVE